MNIKKVLGVAIVASALVLAPATGAMALTSKSVGGGAWQYGVEGGNVISNYHHPSKYHTATTCRPGLFGKQCNQVLAAAGSWAKSKSAQDYFGGNESYWGVL